MARKYATLPDLDSAPDVYETPVGIANNDTRSSSPTSSAYQETSDNEKVDPDASGVDRHNLHPNDARETFQPSRVDARDVDFSDRLDGHRSYRVRRRRKRDRYGKTTEELEYISGRGSDDEEESFEERVARLKREIEEVKVESEERKGNRQQNGDGESPGTTKEDLNQLSSLLATLHTRTLTKSQSFEAPSNLPELPHEVKSPSPLPSLDETSQQTLKRAEDLESRLASLESAIGLHSDLVASPSDSANANGSSASTHSIIQSLSTLERQMQLLSTTTAPNLASLTSQITQLTESATRLEEARKAARSAQEALTSKSSRPVSRVGAGSVPPSREQPVSAPSFTEDPETVMKINAIYAYIPTIESLAPLLPAVVERLRTLRLLHAEAAEAAQGLKEIQRRQGVIGEDLERWRIGLEKVESAVEKGVVTGRQNREEVERWVKELEARVEKL